MTEKRFTNNEIISFLNMKKRNLYDNEQIKLSLIEQMLIDEYHSWLVDWIRVMK